MQITVNIPQTEAIKRGSAKWGAQPIDLEAVLALLTPEEREGVSVSHTGSIQALRRHPNRNGGSPHSEDVDSPTTSPEDIVESLRRAVCKSEEAMRAAEAKARAECEKWLASDAISRPYVSNYDLLPTEYRGRIKAEKKRREDAHEETVRRDILAWAKEASDAYDHDRYPGQPPHGSVRKYTTAVVEAEERFYARKKARVKASREAWISLAREIGSEDLRAAIQEDYPLGGRLSSEVLAYLLPEIPDCERVEYGRSHTGDERAVPNARARALHAAVSAAAKTAQEKAPAGTEIVCGRIERAEWWDKGCRCGKYDRHDSNGDHLRKGTVVPVTVRAPHLPDGAVTVEYLIS